MRSESDSIDFWKRLERVLYSRVYFERRASMFESRVEVRGEGVYCCKSDWMSSSSECSEEGVGDGALAGASVKECDSIF